VGTYLVLTEFIDKFTNVYYAAGSEYETPDEDRAKHLQKLGYLGEEIMERDDDDLDQHLKPLAGGYYVLPNGEKVRGKEKAIKALKQLDEGELDESSKV